MTNLRKDQKERYSRQLVLSAFGEDGQKKLLGSKVLIVGAGGLGSPCALYLAATGVGTIGIVDSDVVGLENLQRQILYSTEDVGKVKVDAAGNRISGLNEDVKVIPYNVRLSSDNIADIIKKYSFIIDCSDNFQTKYLINDVCVSAGKPFSHGGVFGFEGQVITILPGRSACYRCLFPEPPSSDFMPNCSQAGVFGVVPGVIGVIQANEALKYILGMGNLLTDKLLVFSSLESSFRRMEVRKDPKCSVCSGIA